MTSVRLAAVRALVVIERGGTTLAAEMERARASIPAARDRGLLLEIVAGTLRWRNELDVLLAHASARAIADLDPEIRAVLRAGAYQLRHLGRVPAHAILHESVEIARRLGRRSASGFVNAVLRRLATRGSAESVLPPPPQDPGDVDGARRFLSITLSHPEWLVTRWLSRHGLDAARRWCEFNNAAPEMTLRSIAGQSRADLLEALHAAGVDAEPARFLRDSVRVPAGALGRLSEALRASVMVQEEASQIVAHVVGARRHERVLDVCAAPGGKTMVMAADMEGVGSLVAGDRRPGRVSLLREQLRRTRTDAQVVAHDATGPLPYRAVFDRVLVDAPCSGLGTLRRDPDLKWSRSPEDLSRFADTQLQMTLHAADAVRPGGVLVYATCSSEPEENEQVVSRLIAARPEFVAVPAVPGPAVTDGANLVDGSGYLRTLPFAHELDGFFAAVLVRRG